MWITADVDLPARLLEAQERSRLIVFAGAGISIDAPSNLPSFQGLVAAVAGEAGEEAPPWGTVPPDVFLGSLRQDGFPVHERVAAMVTPTVAGAPNSYHFALVRLFREADSVRIVTTNHDPFLSQAAENVFGQAVESFYAPALPVGDEFSGIVYLHGGIERSSDRLVLTDRDFGRAYLTQGWATAFLRGMYSIFDVLFIGYSHGEPVLRYLASGLSASTRRFAFDTADADDSLWQTIGVEKIPYPRSAPPIDHVSLGLALDAWSERTRMGYLRHKTKIQEAVSGLPPLDLEVADYVKQALNDAATAGFFAEYATMPEWLDWLKQATQFTALFGRGEVTPASQELAAWYATKMVLDHPEHALSLLTDMGGYMTPELWFACAHRLWTAEPRPDPAVLAKWTTALLESAPAVRGATFLGYILSKCRWPEDQSLAILLFAHLTDPQPVIGPRLGGAGVLVSVTTRGEAHQLRDAWTTYFEPRIAELSDRLEPIVSGQLVRAHEILRSTGAASDRWDPTSYLLPRIEDQNDE